MISQGGPFKKQVQH